MINTTVTPNQNGDTGSTGSNGSNPSPLSAPKQTPPSNLAPQNSNAAASRPVVNYTATGGARGGLPQQQPRGVAPPILPQASMYNMYPTMQLPSHGRGVQKQGTYPLPYTQQPFTGMPLYPSNMFPTNFYPPSPIVPQTGQSITPQQQQQQAMVRNLLQQQQQMVMMRNNPNYQMMLNSQQSASKLPSPMTPIAPINPMTPMNPMSPLTPLAPMTPIAPMPVVPATNSNISSPQRNSAVKQTNIPHKQNAKQNASKQASARSVEKSTPKPPQPNNFVTNGFQPSTQNASEARAWTDPNNRSTSISAFLDTALVDKNRPNLSTPLYDVFTSNHALYKPFSTLSIFVPGKSAVKDDTHKPVSVGRSNSAQRPVPQQKKAQRRKQKASTTSQRKTQQTPSTKTDDDIGKVFSQTAEDLSFGDFSVALDSGSLSDIDFVLPGSTSPNIMPDIFGKGENEDEDMDGSHSHRVSRSHRQKDNDDFVVEAHPKVVRRGKSTSDEEAYSPSSASEEEDEDFEDEQLTTEEVHQPVDSEEDEDEDEDFLDSPAITSSGKRQRRQITYRENADLDDGDNMVDDADVVDDPNDEDFRFDSEDEPAGDYMNDEDSEFEIVPKKRPPPKKKIAWNAGGKKLPRNKSNMVDQAILDYAPQSRKSRVNPASSDEEDEVWLPASERRRKSSANKTSGRRDVSRKSASYDAFFDSDASESEEKKAVRPLFEEIDEDIIEKVCDFRQRVLLPDGQVGDIVEPDQVEPDQFYVEELLIKWKGWAHIHNTWSTLDYLKQQKGYKKVENYIKKRKQLDIWKHAATAEEIEQQNVYDELEKQMHEKWVQVERVISDKPSTSPDAPSEREYLVKWKYLPYSECTWEFEDTIKHFRHEIDDYEKRKAKHGYEYPDINEDSLEFNKITEPPKWITGGTLREYQLEGVNWLHYSWCTRTNVILADEMGLGKTVQSITFLNYLYHEKNIQGPFLVVVPLSTLSGWLKEFKKWAPDLYVVPYIGDSRSREIIRSFEMFYDVDGGKKLKCNVILTTYESILRDSDFLGRLTYSYLAVDEAHRLKNDKSKLYEVLIEFRTYGRLLITGTPLQNTLKELWCLLHFLMPEKFNSMDAFEKRYSELHSQDKLSDLHEELAPHILRRLKSDVEKSLPKKIERILRVGLSAAQKNYYKWILSRNFSELSRCGSQASLLNIVVELKKVCNHPYLFEGAKEQSREHNELLGLIRASGKMILLDKLLVRLKETGHRVLIFSQMVKMLDVLGRYLSLRGFKFQRLDGSTSSRERQHVVDHFNAEDSTDFCFLLSTRAGGLGINLATADTVIIFDSDWNPQNDLQAEARAHRIGQTKVVNIYRLVTSNSVEEKILEAAKQKMILDHLVIQKMDTSGRTVLANSANKKSYSQFSKQELAEVLRFGAENLFKKDSDNEKEGEGDIKELSEMDITEILARAETTDKTEQEQQQAQSNSLMGAFKVANYAIIDPASVKPPKPSNSKESKEVAKRERDFWKGLMTDDVRRQTQDEPLLYLPARKTRKRQSNVSYGNGGNDQDYDPENNDDDHNSDEDYEVTKKKASKNRIAGFNVKETRAFIKAFKKFPDTSRMKSILQDADLVGKKQEKDVQSFTELFLQACTDAMNEQAKDSGKDESRKAKAKQEAPSLDFNGVKLDPSEILRRVEEINALKKLIETYDDPSRKLINSKTVRQWPCRWEVKDDANLLRGILLYGISNWEQIRLDEELGLGSKILPAGVEQTSKEAKKKLKPVQVARRVDVLLASIVEEAKAEEAKPKKSKKSSEKSSKKSEKSTSKPKTKRKSKTHDEEEFDAEAERAAVEYPAKRSTRSASREESSRSSSKSKERKIEDSEIHDACEAHFSKIAKSLDSLKSMSDDDNLDESARLRMIKELLLIIGDYIHKTIGDKHKSKSSAVSNADDEQLSRVFWTYVQARTKVSSDGPKLEKLYQRLASSKKEETPKKEEKRSTEKERSSKRVIPPSPKTPSVKTTTTSSKKTSSSSRRRRNDDEDDETFVAPDVILDVNRNNRRSTRQAVNYQEPDYASEGSDVDDSGSSKKNKKSSSNSGGSSKKRKANTSDDPSPKRRKK